ncbi:PREDICTED: RING-H2 finger protein ATL46-like [Tarenaya hassleriana]|uniref:RING-H2 finger protein ATL46-like n=1 Tax=Tarenaya hassleriana TaxID=28532 RepID=UPI00053C506A|nr:PREDICTED: RING-H2 finger protein ATL46-like [Tarenaya hassleriana]
MAESRVVKTSWVEFQINQKAQSFAYPPAFSGTPGTVSNLPSTSSPSSGAKVSPVVLFVIVILALLFFVSGVLHLLVRFLLKQRQSASQSSLGSNRNRETSTSDALQRQLQQLFHLHDSGLDQAFIDALPVFQYKEIVGAKEPFDCAVCLCEFSEKDKLRLLPMCSHAFHINCIDTWLLSNSTCPLCRGTLYAPGFPIENVGFEFDDAMEEESRNKSVEMEEITIEKGVIPVRLGKFRKLNDDNPKEAVTGETSSSNLDARRCFSMGSYEYVLGDSELRVPLSIDHQTKRDLQIKSKGESSVDGDGGERKISNMRKGESFSVSKIWLWSKKGKSPSNNRTGIPYSPNIMDMPWMRECNINQS